MTKVNKPSCVCIASSAWSSMFKTSKVYWWTSWNGNGCHVKGVSWGPSSSLWGTRYDSVSLKMGVSWCCRSHCWFAFVLWWGHFVQCLFNHLYYVIWWLHPSATPSNHLKNNNPVSSLINFGFPACAFNQRLSVFAAFGAIACLS